MSYSYKNPISSVIVYGPSGVNLDNNTGTNFSMYNIGGYMEVFNLSDLIFYIPSGSTGTILFSGNTIPINYSNNSTLSAPNVVGLESDGISSGRRRLGMLVYVQETQLTYQYEIDNYRTLFDDAVIAGSLIDLGNGYQCLNDTPEGTLFVNAWTASTIEGVSGITKINARWRLFASSGGTSTTTLYTGDGTLLGNRIVDLSTNTLTFSSQTQPDTLTISGGNVGIGTNSPDSNAILDISSTTKGVLFPRMTTIQRTGMTTTEGMIVYDTDEKKLYLFTTDWEYIQSGGMSGYWNK